MLNKNKLNVGDEIALDGVVKRVFFRNEENGFSIFILEDKNTGLSIIVKGVTGYDVSEGSLFEVSGDVVNDPKFGTQVAAKKIKGKTPDTKESIVKYLTNANIAGVGVGVAKSIVNEFGVDTFNVIEKNPSLLCKIKGIGEKRALEISKAAVKISRERDSVMFLAEIGLTPNQVLQSIKKFGVGKVVEIVKKNPYVLCSVFGISFDAIDDVALNHMGIKKDHPYRVEAIILNHINKQTSFGSVAIKYPFFINGRFGVPKDKVDNRVKEMIEDGIIVIDKGHAYTKEMYESETNVARKIFSLSRQTSPFSGIRRDDIRAVAETKLGFELDPSQLDGIENSLKSSVSIITGGPGVGKTTVLSGLVKVIESYGMDAYLCAPTGVAAKRMKNSTDVEASTIHKLISIDQDGGCGFNDDERHFGKCFIVDETSMLDIVLLNKLVSALDDDAMIIFVGDADQLPSVGPGRVLKDLIESGVITTTKLTKVFRQAAESSIIDNAIRINSKQPIKIDPNKDDFIFIETKNDEETFNEIKYFIETEKACGTDVIDDIQILSPMRKGEVGINNLNEILPDMLNDNKDYKFSDSTLAINDKVMQLANNYEKGVFNGDVGVVVDIKNIDNFGKAGEIIVMFDDFLAHYKSNESSEITKAYSYSVHKSQGSQYPKVVIPLSKEHTFMWDKNLLYTGITRAEDTVVLIGDKGVLNAAISKEKSNNRTSFLAERLKDEEVLALKMGKFKAFSS